MNKHNKNKCAPQPRRATYSNPATVVLDKKFFTQDLFGNPQFIGDIVELINHLRSYNLSDGEVARWLNKAKVPTPEGKPWQPQNVKRHRRRAEGLDQQH